MHCRRLEGVLTIKIIIEIMSWLKDDFDHKSPDRLVLEEIISQGTTIMDLIHFMADKYPKFGKRTLNIENQGLFDYCIMILNEDIVSTPAELNVKLKKGDIVKLVPTICGG